MQVKLDNQFYNEIVNHYNKAVNVETFEVGGINCYAFISDGRQDKEIPSGLPIFEFVKPQGYPVYSRVQEDVIFDTEQFAFIKGDQIIRHSQKTVTCPICNSNDSAC